MLTGPALDRLATAIIRVCRSGLVADALRAAVLPRLREAVPIDALWWAAADPATLLFTRSYREELPEESGRYFVENEFLRQDVNKWTELARDPVGVRTLMEVTGGRPADSERYRDIFAPLGLQDELRAVLRMRDACWGISACTARPPRPRFRRARHGLCGASPRTSPRACGQATDTVQDHLKSVFDKTGVHSRGELVATILQRDYLPRAIAGVPLSRSGAFTAGESRTLKASARCGAAGR